MALDAIANKIEELVGNQPNDLALHAMNHMIETTFLKWHRNHFRIAYRLQRTM
jgi:predicted membrane chloride channel (bestrophin family)